MSTRFGELSIDMSGVLLFNRTPISPRIETNSRLEIGRPFQIGDAAFARKLVGVRQEVRTGRGSPALFCKPSLKEIRDIDARPPSYSPSTGEESGGTSQNSEKLH